MKKYALFALLFTISLCTKAQLTSEKIEEKVQEVDDYILSQDYKEALTVLSELRNKGTDNANLKFKTGYCYLNSVAEKAKALDFLKQATTQISTSYNVENRLEKNAPSEALLYLGDAYRLDNKFNEAVRYYKEYASVAGKSNSEAISIAQKRIKECSVAKVLIKHPIAAKWENLGETINQGIGNLNPVISVDGNTMVFTRKMKFYDAIFFTQKEDGNWKEPVNITDQIGSDGEFYPSGLSSDGSKLLLSTYDMLSGQDIYESTFEKGRWTKFKKLEGSINTKFPEVNATFSPDGKTIYFASNRDNGNGGFDLYSSTQKEDGTWSEAINLSSSINTNLNEKLPRVINNGKQLAFTSQGHLTMGGYDLFYVDLPITNQSKPINFGFPISTTDDNLSFCPGEGNTIGYLAKHESESFGETDIYKVDYSALSHYSEIPVKANLDISGLNPQNDSIALILVDNTSSDTLDQRKINTTDKTIALSLYPGDFTLTAQAPDNQINKANFSVPADVKEDSYHVPITIAFNQAEDATIAAEAKLIVKNDTFKVSNIIFAFNKYAIENEYLGFFEKLAILLKNNPGISISITGYSDAIGKTAYNKSLSLKRAENAKNSLIAKGIPSERITTAGAGNNNFITINTNPDGSDNPEGRKYNRRVELQFSNLPANLIIVAEKNIPEKLKLK